MINSRAILAVLIAVALTLSGCSIGTENGKNNTTSEQVQSVENESAQIEPDETTKDFETTNDTGSTNTNKPINEIDPIKEQFAKMTLDEKIGQMIIVGFKGYEINDNVKSMIQEYHAGGVILFRNNVKSAYQLLQLVNSIKNINSENKVPLFMSVDEEGGRISRMPEELHMLPSNNIIGEINNGDFSFEIGGILAEEVKSFGFNMDFAPVLDIFSNPLNTVISDRAFGTDSEIVSKLGIQTMKGIRAGGVIPVVKHFPGHGDTVIDSHVGLPSVEYDMERLESFELVPFQEAINNQADAVMVAHILMNSVDPKNPASMSKVIITDVLRGQMGFDGVVITDDMTMGAIIENYKISDAVVKSVNAGSDIILVCHGYDHQVNAMNALKAAIEGETMLEDRINESVYRILKLKEKYKLMDDITPLINIDEINKKIDGILSKWYNR